MSAVDTSTMLNLGGREIRLTFGVHAIIEYKKAFGENISETFGWLFAQRERITKGREAPDDAGVLERVSNLLWAGSLDPEDDEPLTIHQVRKLIPANDEALEPIVHAIFATGDKCFGWSRKAEKIMAEREKEAKKKKKSAPSTGTKHGNSAVVVMGSDSPKPSSDEPHSSS